MISIIYENIEYFKESGEIIKDFDLVNYVLAAALKADKIPAIDLGLVLVYLE